MDIKIEIKEGDPLSDDIASHNESEFFFKNVRVKPNSDTLLQDGDCYVAVKTEIKSETLFPDFYSEEKRELFTKQQIMTETVISNNNCEIDIKIELGSQNKRDFLPEDPVMKVKSYNSDQETDYKVEIKEEPWWPENETPSIYDDIKDGDFMPVKSPRLCTKGVSGDISDDFPLLSTDTSRKNTSFSYGKDCQKFGSPVSDVTKMSPAEKCIHSEQSGKCTNGGEVYSRIVMIHKGEKPYECKICNKSFTQMSHLKSHNLIHEGKRPYKCKICEKSYTQMSHLKKHNLIHEDKKYHKCEICEKRFTYLPSLRIHNLIHQGTKPHKCEICEKSFTHLSSLKSHYWVHEGKKPFKCQLCEKMFTQLSSLKSHNLIHEGVKPHKCKICEKSFIHLSSFKLHNLKHEGKRPYKCEICEKSFALPSLLKSHNFIHGGKNLFACEICNKNFTHLSSLKRHNLLHEGKRPHKCEICDKTFTQLSSLKRHNLIHEDVKPYKCEICQKPFTHLSSLKSHYLMFEGKSLTSVNFERKGFIS